MVPVHVLRLFQDFLDSVRAEVFITGGLVCLLCAERWKPEAGLGALRVGSLWEARDDDLNFQGLQ